MRKDSSRRTVRLLVSLLSLVVLCFGAAPAVAGVKAAAFKVLAFYSGTYDAAHISFVKEANAWFPKAAAQNGFSYTATNDWSKLNAGTLAQYQVVLFLDDLPQNASQRTAFQNYVQGGGGFFGFHVSAFTTDQGSWSWYHNDFLGSGAFKSNTWGPTAETMHTDNASHAASKNLSPTWKSSVSEWYSWTKNLRANPAISVLASIDQSSFPVGTDPNQSWYRGDYPILWTNKNYRMLYANFGHNAMDYEHNTPLSSTFGEETQNRFVLDGLKWLGAR